jgi:8-oxo-dGTP diphosphatase
MEKGMYLVGYMPFGYNIAVGKQQLKRKEIMQQSPTKTTLCYIEKDGKYLMLYRNKKKEDPNGGKWIGVGGKFEEGETPFECVKREVLEETGIIIRNAHFYGVIEFRSDGWPDEDMYLFSSNDFDDSEFHPEDCCEGTLKFIPKDEILELNLWEGDRVFLCEMLEGQDRINLRLRYSGENLTEVVKHSYSDDLHIED